MGGESVLGLAPLRPERRLTTLNPMAAPAPLPEPIMDRLAAVLGAPPTVRGAAGGVHRAATVEAGGERAFLKWHPAPPERIFLSEAEGLRAMAGGEGYAVPAVLDVHEGADGGYLLLERLELGGPRDEGRLAAGLAGLHALAPTAERGNPEGAFGWAGGGYLGRIAHPNRWHATWAGQFVEDRLRPHVAAAAPRGRRAELLERVIDAAPALLDDAGPPQLVHGDLWGGNHGVLPDGTPAFFDPSPAWSRGLYDLGFSRGFGSYGPRFYEAYFAHAPGAAGSGVPGASRSGDRDLLDARLALMELILMLVHEAMFGGGYAGRVDGLARTVLAAA